MAGVKAGIYILHKDKHYTVKEVHHMTGWSLSYIYRMHDKRTTEKLWKGRKK